MRSNIDKNNYKTKLKVGDYPVSCHICGNWSWYSQSIVQHKYTGKGGTIACKNCADEIHYGLVPYKVLPEKAVPVVSNSQPEVTAAEEIDFTTSPPRVSGS